MAAIFEANSRLDRDTANADIKVARALGALIGGNIVVASWDALHVDIYEGNAQNYTGTIQGVNTEIVTEEGIQERWLDIDEATQLPDEVLEAIRAKADENALGAKDVNMHVNGKPIKMSRRIHRILF